MPGRKLILRKEHFGGIFLDTSTGGPVFLSPERYEQKKISLEEAQERGAWVKFFDAREKGYVLLPDAASSPIDLFFELTKRCNGHCIDCFMDANADHWSHDEISLADIEKVARQFSDSGGYYIRLSGGEPTLRADFFDIVDIIRSEGLIIGLNTNGYYGEKKLDKILSTGIKDIRVSLDGPEPINDTVRGKGTFRRILRTLAGIAEFNRYAEEPVHLTVNVVLMKSNMNYVEEMIGLAQKFDAKISFGLLRVSGRAERREMLSPSEVVKSTLKVQKARRLLGLARESVRINYDILCPGQEKKASNPYPFDNSKCPIGLSGITLDAFGRAVPCGYLVGFGRWVGEDVRKKGLLHAWHHSSVLIEARKVVRPGCRDCKYHKVHCNGGCPVMAYVFEGDIDGRDPYCVRKVPAPSSII